MFIGWYVIMVPCRPSESSTSESESESIPSLDSKCQPGCWYCEDLCHCCMHPVSLWATELPKISPEPDEPLPKFCGGNCQELVRPKPGSSPKVSATFNKKKSVGPAKLQILKSVLPPGATFSKLEYVELCIGDGFGGRPVGTPYVLWQIRSINSQSFMAFSVNNEFEPLESLWTSKNPLLNINLAESTVKIRISQLLNNVFKLVLEKIGYKSLDTFVADNLPDVHVD